MTTNLMVAIFSGIIGHNVHFAIWRNWCIQWNLSITDTLGTEKQFVIQRFPLFRGCFIYMAIHSDPQKQSVIERFPLLGEFVIRGSSVIG